MMTLENTDGYTQQELDVLNAEFENRFAAGDWEGYSFDREQAEKAFADEVSRR